MNRAVRGTLLLLLLLAPAGVHAAESAAFELGFSVVTEDNNPAEFLLLSPKLGGQRLGTSVTAYHLDGVYYLPLFATARMLELGIRPGPRQGTAQGFIIDEGRGFTLDVAAKRAVFSGRAAEFSADQVQVREDDIYVDSRLLSVWFPLSFDINTFASVLEFKPTEPMPIQLRMDRERRLKALQLGRSVDGLYPRYSTPYRMWDGPFLDQTVLGRARSNALGNELGASYSTYLAADVAYLETTAYLFGDETEPLRDYRISAGRHDFYGRLLGPLQAREFAGGHLYAETVPLVYNSRIVLGGNVSNFPLGRNNEQRGHTFRGPLPPGWLVELYRQEVLLDYRRSDATGLYVFEDVPLNMGINRFKLVFYGPYGERREEAYAFNLADSIPEPGEFYYRVTGGQEEFLGGMATVTGEFGVHENVALTSSLTSMPQSGRQRQFASLGARSFFGPVYARSNLVAGQQGKLAAEGALQTQAYSVNLSGAYLRLQEGFDSAIFPSSPFQLADRAGVGADYSTMVTAGVPLNATVDLSRDRFRNASHLWRIQSRLGSSFASFALANRVALYRSIAQIDSSYADGAFALSRNVDPRGRVRASGEFGYYVYPLWEPRGFSTQLSAELPLKTIGVLGFGREFRGETRTEAGLSKDFDVISAGVTYRYVYPRVQEVFLQMSLGMGYVRPRRDVHLSSQSMGGSGSAVVRMFIDTNQNGRWDAGEQPLTGAGILVNGTASQLRTGSDGMLFVPQLAAYQPADIAPSMTSFRNGGLMPAIDGVNIVPRPGRIATVDIPVIQTGEIDGTVFLVRNGIKQELPGMRVELVDRRGKVLHQISAYDGFYLFQRIPAGAYELRISPEQLRELGYKPIPGKSMLITPDGAILNGNDLLITVE